MAAPTPTQLEDINSQLAAIYDAYRDASDLYQRILTLGQIDAASFPSDHIYLTAFLLRGLATAALETEKALLQSVPGISPLTVHMDYKEFVAKQLVEAQFSHSHFIRPSAAT